MILACGILLWLVAGIATWQLIAYSKRSSPLTQLQITLLLAVLSAGSILLFRPHLEMFGGEDAGAYLNSSVTYAREGTLFPADPLLSLVPAPVRPIFFYNVGLYGQTKDGVLWIKNLSDATLRPHFQPAYPLMMSLPAAIGPTRLILYVAPLFTLLAALSFWALGTQLFRCNWAGLATAAFFLASPVTVWHGRCARAEMPAVFFLFAGLFFLLHAWKNKNANQLPAIILGSICVFASTFFHILTWLAIIPLSICFCFVLFNGRKEFLAYFLCCISALVLFLLQTVFVTDTYFLGESLGKAYRALTPTHLATLLLIAIAFIVFLTHFRKIRCFIADSILSSPRWLGMIVLIFSLCGFFFVVFLGDAFPVRGVLQPYLRWTDFEGIGFLLSKPILLLGLVGGILLVLRQGRGGQNERILLWIILLPGILLMGWVENYMLDNRRFVLFLIPWLALSFAAIIMLLQERIPGKAYTASAGVLLILMLTIQNRTHLYTLQEYEGLLDFFAPFAQTVKENNGILLFEYTRFGAIFNHFFGIPTLSLNNEVHPDYSEAEKAWRDIMLTKPERPAYFATPFQTPQSEHFDFNPVRHDHYSGYVLKQERRRLPTRINAHSIDLKLYRMSLKSQRTTKASSPIFPYHAQMNMGNMGLTQFANLRRSQMAMVGIPFPGGKEVSLPLRLSEVSDLSELMFIIHASGGESQIPPDMGVIGGEAHLPVQWSSLTPDWWLASVLLSDWKHPDTIVLRPQSDLILCGIYYISGGNIKPVAIEALPGSTQVVIPFIQARWARNNANMLLPLPETQVDVFILMKEAENQGPREIHLKDGSELLATFELQPNNWSWHMLRLPSTYADKDRFRLTFRVPSPWDPGLSNFPSDLAVLVGHVSVVPQ